MQISHLMVYFKIILFSIKIHIGILALTTLIQHCTEACNYNKKQEKETKGIRIGKEKGLSLFVCEYITHEDI